MSDISVLKWSVASLLTVTAPHGFFRLNHETVTEDTAIVEIYSHPFGSGNNVPWRGALRYSYISDSPEIYIHSQDTARRLAEQICPLLHQAGIRGTLRITYKGPRLWCARDKERGTRGYGSDTEYQWFDIDRYGKP